MIPERFPQGRGGAGHHRGQAVLQNQLRRDSVPTRRLSMRKIKEVLRLKFELGLGQRQIARSCSISQSTVHNYLKRAAAAGLGWPLPEGWEESRLNEARFGEDRPAERKSQRPLPEFRSLQDQLQRHPHLTLQLAWEEYRQANPEGYRYSWFCERYRKWLRKQDVVLRQEHKADEKGFVDWAGATIPVQDLSQWSRTRVNIDYHIAFEANLHSVPYTLVHELVEVRATPATVEIFHKGQRVASHLRGRGRGQVFTQREHRPKSHQAHLEWTPSRMVNWAQHIGPHTARLFERILEEKPHPEMRSEERRVGK